MLALALLAAAPAAALPATCDAAGACSARMSADQLLAAAERLVQARQYEAARPFLAALAVVPGRALERRFLAGFIAVETGDIGEAVTQFRAILADDPRQTRVRLELARALLMQGEESAADHHLRLASQDRNLPPEIAATIRTARGVIRDQRAWSFSFDLGVAPDTNINNATSAEEVDLLVSPNNRLPFTLDKNARARSGTGLTGSVSGSYRARAERGPAWLTELDSQFTIYGIGNDFNDASVQLASGPEWKLSKVSNLTVQAVGLQRWFGGLTAQRQLGVKAGLQSFLDKGQRVGLQVDGRRTESGFGTAFDGWQYGAVGTYERVVARSMIASASLFVRREALRAAPVSNTEVGVNAGLGGELRSGINAGVSGGVSYAGFDAPTPMFSDRAREDLRINLRAYFGLRTIRVLGFSPAITYGYTHIGSNYRFFDADRHRFRFTLARYF